MNSLLKAPPSQADYRYIMTVFLIRDGRAKYWEFHCPYCTQKVCELDGTIVQMRDISHNTENEPPIMIRCPGTDKKWCRYWYAFQLSN